MKILGCFTFCFYEAREIFNRLRNSFYGLPDNDFKTLFNYSQISCYMLFLFLVLTSNTNPRYIYPEKVIAEIVINKIGLTSYKIIIIIMLIILIESTLKALTALFKNLFFQLLRYKIERGEKWRT